MKKVIKTVPLILVIVYALSHLLNNWENMNGIKIFDFIFSMIFPLYLIFMILTEKYIDFKNGVILKSFPTKNQQESNYFGNFILIISFILLITYLYNSFFLEINLIYLLYILIGLSILGLILKYKKL